mmetsp:Transcript_48775/g.136495  ORF Transcript_48775/g.136495 Transcript_48775/m.136495 type:complete len:219 (+) Transcript_48775:963-1619(+)
MLLRMQICLRLQLMCAFLVQNLRGLLRCWSSLQHRRRISGPRDALAPRGQRRRTPRGEGLDCCIAKSQHLMAPHLHRQEVLSNLDPAIAFVDPPNNASIFNRRDVLVMVLELLCTPVINGRCLRLELAVVDDILHQLSGTAWRVFQLLIAGVSSVVELRNLFAVLPPARVQRLADRPGQRLPSTVPQAEELQTEGRHAAQHDHTGGEPKPPKIAENIA